MFLMDFHGSCVDSYKDVQTQPSPQTCLILFGLHIIPVYSLLGQPLGFAGKPTWISQDTQISAASLGHVAWFHGTTAASQCACLS